MTKLKIDTSAVVTAAGNISRFNKQMKDGIPSMQRAIDRLNSTWSGEAATAAIKKFNEIKAGFFDARYNVLDNYVNFLLNQVGEGYTQTETVNKSLAAQFK